MRAISSRRAFWFSVSTEVTISPPASRMSQVQFDSKGVEFGPWLRRFRAQIYRNWFIPYAAMTMKGHVVLTFYVQRDGRITELRVLKPSAVDAFTNSASNALAA